MLSGNNLTELCNICCSGNNLTELCNVSTRNMMSGLFDWTVVFNWVVFVIFLTLLVLIRIALSVFRLVLLRHSRVDTF